ncbi:MAG: putative transport system ATP-binding protein [Petroclostridium sp.]|jgi:putative ABC transport system ATP-binding protein|uniref:ABC transporter ATP-binding protein n=1 Tax=Petroclostridium xylanilyticum TaxID=1792311 RepID=UPI000B9890C8|nr:ABC transporter ATP-binding protein [Petroclostridium xylanilyticum]MBZ4647452.1 transporter related protein [Clostridia bacterium]MDK2811700.1 putative transport system ATP-binding protein [Petroclostridium sp.]
MIRIEEMYKIYKMGDVEVKALNGVSIHIKPKEFVSIVGPSGSGKSTLMNMIGCLDTPTSGKYYIDGREVSRLKDDELAEIRNKKIGFIFQGFNLLPKLTAIENVELPLIYRGVGKKERHKMAVEALERVGLGHRLHHKPSELSGGQQQRVAIARALSSKPPLILADEPTGNLDSKSGVEIMKMMHELHEMGNTIVLITHDNDIALQAKRIIRIQDGSIVEDREVN